MIHIKETVGSVEEERWCISPLGESSGSFSIVEPGKRNNYFCVDFMN
jgi:hypothetical protein